MKTLILCLILIIMCCGSACAMNLDVIKRHFLNSEWKGGIREGESLLAKARRDSPGLDELYYYLALCYLKDGNYLRASDICEIILNEFKRSKFSEQAHFVLIDAYAGNNNFGQARSQAESFLKKYPDSPHSRNVRERLAEFKHHETDLLSIAHATAQDSPSTEADIVLASDAQQDAVNASEGHSFWVQVGAFSSDRNANNLARKLRAASFDALVSEGMSKGKPIFKVRAGPYNDKASANAAAKKLSRDGYPTKIIP
jgi:tetratricopeptide (TPR) repeat protein